MHHSPNPLQTQEASPALSHLTLQETDTGTGQRAYPRLYGDPGFVSLGRVRHADVAVTVTKEEVYPVHACRPPQEAPGLIRGQRERGNTAKSLVQGFRRRNM